MTSISNWLTQTTDNPKYADILHRRGFSVNMRLFNNNKEYRELIISIVEYLIKLLNTNYSGFSPIGISGANIGVPFNIIAFKPNRVLINPEIIESSKEKIIKRYGCGSIPEHHLFGLPVKRHTWIKVRYFDIGGKENIEVFNSKSAIIQHEIDHNLGILITDY